MNRRALWRIHRRRRSDCTWWMCGDVMEGCEHDWQRWEHQERHKKQEERTEQILPESPWFIYLPDIWVMQLKKKQPVNSVNCFLCCASRKKVNNTIKLYSRHQNSSDRLQNAKNTQTCNYPRSTSSNPQAPQSDLDTLQWWIALRQRMSQGLDGKFDI